MNGTSPIVNGKARTFAEIGQKLGIGPDGARRRYNQCAHLVTWHKLRAWDRATAQRAKRDARILQLRQLEGKELQTVQALVGGRISLQRVQQIAGAIGTAP